MNYEQEQASTIQLRHLLAMTTFEYNAMGLFDVAHAHIYMATDSK